MIRAFTLDFALAPSVPDAFAELPWDTLSPRDFPPAIVERARHFFTENAFNEYASALAMSQLSTALGHAETPIDLWSQAASFPRDELGHVELCARTALRLGGAVPFSYDPDSLVLPSVERHGPFMRATALVVRVCCLGEAVAQPLLAGNLRAATHPLPRAVLGRIVADETRHARFGWQYLDWAAPRLGAEERRELAAMVAAALAPFAGLLTRRHDDEPPSGLGWMAPSEWRALAAETIATRLVAPLRRHGIDVDWPAARKSTK